MPEIPWAVGRAAVDEVRRSAGWPEDPDEPPTSDQLDAYISALEASVAGQAMAIKTIGELSRV